MMKKNLLLCVLVVSTLTLSACILTPKGRGKEPVTVTEKPEVEEPEGEEPGTKEPEKKDKEKKESEVGKRSNPVPLGHVATFPFEYYGEEDDIQGTVSLTISKPVRGEEAYNYLLSVSKYNDPAPEGFEWLIFEAKLTLDEGSSDEPYYASPRFKVISTSGSEVDQQSMYASVNDAEEFGHVDLYEGGETSGKIALIVPVGEEILIEFDEWPVSMFYSIQ